MEVYDENGLLILVVDNDDSNPMEDMLSVDLKGGDSGIVEGSTGRSLAYNGILICVGTTQGFGVPIGLKGDNNLTVNGGTLGDNVNGSSMSLPVRLSLETAEPPKIMQIRMI